MNQKEVEEDGRKLFVVDGSGPLTWEQSVDFVGAAGMATYDEHDSGMESDVIPVEEVEEPTSTLWGNFL